MRFKLNPLQKRSAEDMIYYYHSMQAVGRTIGEGEENPFNARYETEKKRLSESLGRPVAVKGEGGPCYRIVDSLNGKTLYREGDK